MGKAEDLLATLDVKDPKLLTAVIDATNHVTIRDDHTIVVPEDVKQIAVQYDHCMESVVFDGPRYIDGNDVTEMKIYVNYARSDGELGSHFADDVEVDTENENIIHFSWPITSHVSSVSGSVQFLVSIKKTDEKGKISNMWSTELNGELYVARGMKTTNTVVSRYPDLVTQILERLDEEMTKENIISALGYEPASKEDINDIMAELKKLQTQ